MPTALAAHGAEFTLASVREERRLAAPVFFLDAFHLRLCRQAYHICYFH